MENEEDLIVTALYTDCWFIYKCYWCSDTQIIIPSSPHHQIVAPTIKFMATYDLPFLDTEVSIGADGYIKTNLYIKPGTKCTYLAPSTSSHPNFISKNILFSLAYRLVRICSDPSDLTHHLRVLNAGLQT